MGTMFGGVSSSSFSERYTVAYSFARGTLRTVKVLRGVGVASCILILILGVMASANTNNDFYAGLDLVFAVLVLLGSIALYAVLAAQAQIMAAVLDTAINTSPIIENARKSAMIETL